MHVRPARVDDAERISALMTQLGYDVRPDEIARRLQSREARREIFVAALGDRVVGWAAASTDEPFVEGYEARLEGLVVDESARSAGVGARLLDAAEAWARERGCAAMRVQSNVVRERAHAFYRQHGYETIKAQYSLHKRLEAEAPDQFTRPKGTGVAIEIRKVETEADFARLYDLFVAYEAGLPKDLRHGAVPAHAELVATYTSRNAAFLATSAGEYIGCVAVREFDSQKALMVRLFVCPEARGHGAARSLVSEAIAFTRECGYKGLILDTNKEKLMPAYLLYRSLGFEECEPFAAVSYECPTFMELKGF